MIIRITSYDLPRAVSNLTMLASQISIRMKTSTKRVAEQILQDSKTIQPTVPVKTGDLESTGRVEPTPQGHAVLYGGSSQSGANVDYAEFVHDDLRPRKYTKPGSGPKFLETHVLRRMEEMPTVFGEELEEIAIGVFNK